MTCGEMAQWTNRLRSILKGHADIRDERLAAMMRDLEDAHGVQVASMGGLQMTVIRGWFAARLYDAVKEWREVS